MMEKANSKKGLEQLNDEKRMKKIIYSLIFIHFLAKQTNNIKFF